MASTKTRQFLIMPISGSEMYLLVLPFMAKKPVMMQSFSQMAMNNQKGLSKQFLHTTMTDYLKISDWLSYECWRQFLQIRIIERLWTCMVTLVTD